MPICFYVSPDSCEGLQCFLEAIFLHVVALVYNKCYFRMPANYITPTLSEVTAALYISLFKMNAAQCDIL